MIRLRTLPLASGLIVASVAVVLSFRISDTPGAALATVVARSSHTATHAKIADSVAAGPDHKDVRENLYNSRFFSTYSSPSTVSGNKGAARDLSASKRAAFFEPGIPSEISPSLEGVASANPALDSASSGFAKKGNWFHVNHKLPGNSLSLDGKRVEISDYQKAPGSVGVGLSLEVVADQTPVETVLAQDVATQAEGSSSPVRTAAETPAGFTYEEELFRTKWGWAAFDQARKVLREETSQ